MPTGIRVGIALKGSNLEIGVICREKIVFSTFSFFGRVKKRLKTELVKRGWEHDPDLDTQAGYLLERALCGEDVFDWSLLTTAQKRVLGELSRVKEKITYGELARRCGTSPRAVGSILRSNPFAPFIPCHRVVAKKGVGGFSTGVEEKKKMLELETKASPHAWVPLRPCP